MRQSKRSRAPARPAVIVRFTRAMDGGSFAVVKFPMEQFAVIKAAAKSEGLPVSQFLKNAIAGLTKATLREGKRR